MIPSGSLIPNGTKVTKPGKSQAVTIPKTTRPVNIT